MAQPGQARVNWADTSALRRSRVRISASISASLRWETATDSGHADPTSWPARRHSTNGRASSSVKPAASNERISATRRRSDSS